MSGNADNSCGARQFNPTTFDPDAWIDLAEAAGISYMVFTTKHLDGF